MSTASRTIRLHFSALMVFALAAVLWLAGDRANMATAATKAQRTTAAEELVQEALHREIYGLQSERVSLLDEARKQAPDYAPAMWHTGHVWDGREWVKAVDVPQFTTVDPRLQMYERQRLRTIDSAAGQYELANWCRKMKLAQRERAHLARVIELNPDHADARQRLGFRPVNGQWVNVFESQADAREAREQAQTNREWVTRLEKVLRGFDGNRLQHETAKRRLAEVRDPAAAPAVEALFAAHSEPAALAAVRTLHAMQAHEADLILARIAVLSQWSAVRTSAIERLRERPLANFVPDLLEAMYTPVKSTWQVTNGPGGRLLFRQTFVREGRERSEQLVLDTGYRRIAAPGGDGTDTLARALTDAMLTSQVRGIMQVGQNLTGQQLNDRIVDVLADVTGEQIEPQASAWWQWWDEYNQIARSDVKPVDTRYQYREITLVDRVAAPGGGSQSSGGGGQACECLAAGSKLWTDMGVKPIEEVQVGDLVLSQDPETGELAFKPVLQFTIRPASELMTLRVGGQEITTSKGHLFWVSGEGWVMARDVSSGAELHALEGTVQLSLTKPAKFEPAYNLIVADFNTYFVGERKPILCHDNSTPRKTNAVVPGLIDR